MRLLKGFLLFSASFLMLTTCSLLAPVSTWAQTLRISDWCAIGLPSGDLLTFSADNLGESAVQGGRWKLSDFPIVGLRPRDGGGSSGDLIAIDSRGVVFVIGVNWLDPGNTGLWENRDWYIDVHSTVQLSLVPQGETITGLWMLGSEIALRSLALTSGGGVIHFRVAGGAIIEERWIGLVAELPVGLRESSVGSLKGSYRPSDQ